jgi:hypothetical protein
MAVPSSDTVRSPYGVAVAALTSLIVHDRKISMICIETNIWHFYRSIFFWDDFPSCKTAIAYIGGSKRWD